MSGPNVLSRPPLYQEVAEQLRQRIFNRSLEPGAWVDELRVCADLGISRTPLREALKVLASEGLVTMKPRRGAYVTEMSERDVREAYALLSLLESDAVANLAATRSDQQLLELERLHAELESSQHQREAFFATNERFHLRLLELEGNRWRQQIVGDLRRLMKLNRHHSLFRQGRVQESLREHRELMVALRNRQPDQARALMRAHFAQGLDAAVPLTAA
ncbi:MAG: GntR family transcriptional regulator [Burkholderiales bacterium]|uniref:GntR family transcriptional regulator n=1 Tax=Inhella sp. TaxID=1921806 RepID=UPI001AC35E78|nr:GntR family transcriptional regulator [Burkholderiales bacterium]